tara:strand:- start:247 stop:474 length:228 start_codon:yes stop_codon:yes gene_type:complete
MKHKEMTIQEHAERLLEIKDIAPQVFKGMLDEISNMSEGGTGGPYPNGRPVRDVFYYDDKYTDEYFKQLLEILKS